VLLPDVSTTTAIQTDPKATERVAEKMGCQFYPCRDGIGPSEVVSVLAMYVIRSGPIFVFFGSGLLYRRPLAVKASLSAYSGVEMSHQS
jgi:hypothetical protein